MAPLCTQPMQTLSTDAFDADEYNALLLEGSGEMSPSVGDAEHCTHFHIVDRVHLAITKEHTELDRTGFAYFSIEDKICYFGFADDFGPMHLGSIYQFCEVLCDELDKHEKQFVALQSLSDPRSVTNAVFLLGSYMIMKLDYSLQQVTDGLEVLTKMLVPYRDVTPGVQNFNLYVHDCWEGLVTAKQLGWVDFGPEAFDLEEYQHLDSPLNADLHEIVPGKFLALRGPRDNATGALWEDILRSDGTFSHREFSPAHYAEILPQFDVQVVVRLNAPQYGKKTFVDAGIAVADLFFEDCTPPPVDVVAKFLAIAEALPGALAVHCQAGLGRTGTLIALYMMKHYGFSARAAMGWLRIVRPGSVIGEQQDFLCARESLMRKSSAPLRPGGDDAQPPPPPEDVAAVERLIEETIRAYDVRYAVAVRDSTVPRGGAESRALGEHVAEATNRRNGLRALASGR
jgi:cell division cycle 14